MSLPTPLRFGAWTFDPFYKVHLVPVKSKAPASYSLNLGAKGWLVQMTLLTARSSLCAEVEKKQSSSLWNSVLSAELNYKLQQFVPDLWSVKLG